jgi:hypothetical protein
METITSKPDSERDFTGCVLSLREMNGYSDSDFYATVWDEEQGCVREIFDGTTRAYAPTKYHKADASPAIRAKAMAWYVQNPQVRATAKVALEAKRAKVSNGDQVVVEAGRKLPLGTQGQVCWIGQDAFNAKALRVCLVLADGSKVFTALGNVAKLNVPPVTDEEITEEVFRTIIRPVFY